MLNIAEFKKKIRKYIPRVFMAQRLPNNVQNSVVLTFDDGPDKLNTPAVLTILKKYDVRAIFFIVGNRLEKAPHVLNMIAEEGHIIANHSYSHNGLNKLSAIEYYKDLKRCQNLISSQIVSEPRMFRPPNGSLSLKSLIIPRILGMKVIMWSLDGSDWDCKCPEKAKIIGCDLGSKVVPGDIVLLHDDNPNTLIILEHLLLACKQKNIDFYSGVEFF